jgi:hypothetical protein
VTREPASTALTLSTTMVKLGQEQAEHLIVQVSPKFTGPAPAGKVTIKAGTTGICTIILVQATGGCTLSASRLPPGTYSLTAAYPATSPYAGSTSPKQTLTVTK